MTILPYSDVCDMAKLTLLVYEYSKSFTLNENETIETFVKNSDQTEKSSSSSVPNDVIKDLSESSPHGRVVKFYSIEETDLQVGITISETHKRVCVIFRGSESKSDWYYDLQFLKTNLHDDVYVHRGFYKQLHTDNMYEVLKTEILKLMLENPDYGIYVTGHSLGGALSTLFGYELSRDITDQVTIVSFASPRVGNPKFRKSFDAQSNLTHYRVSNERDVVTAAPMINFQHVGTNICLKENSFDIFYNYSYNSWYQFSLFKCFSVSEHYMTKYYERLMKCSW